MKRLLLILALLFSVPLAAGCSGGGEEAQYQRALTQASKDARAHIGFFWQHFDARTENEYDFLLKVAFPRRDGQKGEEHIWVENIARTPEGYAAQLANQPQFLGDLKEGGEVTFTDPMISDWAFFQGEKLLGHYTTRVMLPRLPSDQADSMRSMFGANPD